MPVVRLPRFLTFWSINGPLDRASCVDQLRRMRALGFDGAVFHPRFYPGRPEYLGDEYLEILSAVVIEARDMGMAIWIYDEDGWPSGTVGGEMLKQHPEMHQQWAGLYHEPPAGGEVLTTFDRGGQEWSVVRRDGPGVDYLNRSLAGHFLELTHERYRCGLSAEAFAHVEAFFCDEPEFGLGHAYDALAPDGAIPWSADLPARYAARNGKDLLQTLPGIFFREAGAAEDRVHFWEFLLEEFGDGFLSPIDRWCRKHGKRFTAHIKGEEHPLFQVPMVGSSHGVFRRIGMPGIDSLERFPGNDFFPRQCASAARQFGDGRCMAEVFGGAGWGAGPGDFERYVTWLAGHGLTDFVVHLWQYDLSSNAIRDWPASLPVHMNWAEAFPEVLERVRRALRESPSRSADILIVTPHRGIMAAYEPWELLQTNVHNAATYPATPAGAINDAFMHRVRTHAEEGRTCDYVDEATFEQEARQDDDGWWVGEMHYAHVEVAVGARLTVSIQAKLDADFAPAAVVNSKNDALKWGAAELRWQPLCPPRRNGMLLDVQLDEKGYWCALLDVGESLETPVSWEFADTVADVTLDGSALAVRSMAEGVRRTMAEGVHGLGRGMHELRFKVAETVRSPFVWARGDFKVKSSRPWELVQKQTVFTSGSLYLTRPPAELAAAAEMVAAGYGQLDEPLRANGELELFADSDVLHLQGGEGDAGRVWIDDQDCGWIWGPDWQLVAPAETTWAKGSHAVQIEWATSTYNVYGPHHYFAGDHFVVSPDQFTGKRNFADPADAPEHTHVPGWHFRTVRLPVTARAALRKTLL